MIIFYGVGMCLLLLGIVLTGMLYVVRMLDNVLSDHTANLPGFAAVDAPSPSRHGLHDVSHQPQSHVATWIDQSTIKASRAKRRMRRGSSATA